MGLVALCGKPCVNVGGGGVGASGVTLGRMLFTDCVVVVGRGCRGSDWDSNVMLAQKVWLFWAGGCEQGVIED